MTLHLPRPHGRIAYDVVGAGPLVLLVPGMGDLRSAWRFTVPALVAAGYRVATMDLRGHGDSDATFPSYAPEEVAADMLALQAELGEPVVLVGHSAAAAAAVGAAADGGPDRVRALVLVGPVVRDAMALGPIAHAVLRMLFLPWWGRPLWSAYYRMIYKATPPADHDEHVAAIVATLGERERRRAVLEVGMSTKAGLTARIPEVRVPVMAVIGSLDPDFPAEAEGAWLAERLHADVTLLPGVGHYPHQEAADATQAAILGFLERHPCRAA